MLATLTFILSLCIRQHKKGLRAELESIDVFLALLASTAYSALSHACVLSYVRLFIPWTVA